jgi:dTDP-4-dehydrorhamnose 3,5-epimerase
VQRIETSLPGVYELRPRVFQDERGFFMDTYQRAKFAAFGINDSFVQDNHSCSIGGTLRGLHYQLVHAQAKICRVIEGDAMQVSVDIRCGSPHFGKWTSVLLSAKQHNQVYVPRGFANGFLALSERVQFIYKCSDFYDPSDEHGVLWSDPDLGIRWGISNPLLSDRDARFPRLAAVRRELLPQYRAL